LIEKQRCSALSYLSVIVKNFNIKYVQCKFQTMMLMGISNNTYALVPIIRGQNSHSFLKTIYF